MSIAKKGEEEFSPIITKITGGDGKKNLWCNIDIPELDEYGDYCPFDDDDNDDEECDQEEEIPSASLTRNNG
ncbi:hypothetical protein [uncultured Cloacibacillus sp.]|uniref:hypothetical protein n=1 Tax=uncultured Cloacibacillus sp. TaxID=889794 RepID=UPI0027D962F8|nr:hypothetical protein [uncultured Cloacibacillus sp.]